MKEIRKLKNLWVLLLWMAVNPLAAHAQDEVEVGVGDTLVLGRCTGGKSFAFIDLYQKTRFPDDSLYYNRETGDGFYESFFGSGDFDVSRLPCMYAGTRFRIASIQSIKDKEGKERLVVFGVLKEGEKVIWIELEPAFSKFEVDLP